MIPIAVIGNRRRDRDIAAQKAQMNRDIATDTARFVMQGPHRVDGRRQECFRALQGAVEMGGTEAKNIGRWFDQGDALFLIC